jgi:hypothetical protein
MNTLTRYTIGLAIVAAYAWGAANQPLGDDSYKEACGTDTECEEQCMRDLRPDENPDVCAVEL